MRPAPDGCSSPAPIANLGEAKHPLDHPDAVLDLGTYPGLPAGFFATLHLVHDATMAVASVGEILARGACLQITACWPRYA